MRRFFKVLFVLCLLFLSGIITVFTINTISFSSKQIAVPPVEQVKVSRMAIERLSEAVKIPTISYEDGMDTAAFRRLDTFMQNSFPLVDSLLEKETVGGFSYIFKWQGQNARLAPVLLLAHTDVVPVEESSRSAWLAGAFSGTVKDGFVWGRGSMDDKSSVCGILEAVEMLLAVDYVPQRTVYLAFGHDEEVSGLNGAKQIAGHFQQQGLTFEFVLDEGMLVVENALPGLEKPLALIGLSEKGYATLDLSVSLKEGGHSSMPPKASAINLLSTAIVKLKNNPSPAYIEGPVRVMLEHAGPEMSLPYKVLFANLNWTEGLLKWQMSQDPASNALLRTTFAPTVVGGGFKENVLPSRSSAKINCRILPGETVESVTRYVQSVINDERIEISPSKTGQAGDPPPVSSTETFGYQTIQTTIRQIFPEAVVAPSLVIGATDSRHYLNSCK
jgi:carboxypeptidase PM20D1